jgi:hypothetical protein
MLVFNEAPAMNAITEGSLVTAMIQPNTMFQVGTEEMGEDGGFSMSSFSFSSSADLLVAFVAPSTRIFHRRSLRSGGSRQV